LRKWSLNVEIASEAGVFLDVLEAQLGPSSHQGFDQGSCPFVFFDGQLDRGGIGLLRHGVLCRVIVVALR